MWKNSLRISLALCGLFLTGCPEEGPAEEAGEELDEAADEIGDEFEDATDG